MGSRDFGKAAMTDAPISTANPTAGQSQSALQHNVRCHHIPGLNGLRAVAVFLVIFYHIGWEYVPGSYGVMMFFVISGFLITWLLLKEYDQTGRVSLRDFYRRRTLRIFPAFYVYCFGLVAVLLVFGRPVPWAHATSAIFYVSNYYNAILGDPNNGFSHTWSLAIEEQFYLLWPTLLLLLRRRPDHLPWALAGIIVAVWLYRFVLCFGFQVDQAYLYASFDTRFDSLMVGCLLAVVLRQRRLDRLVNGLTLNPWLPLPTLALLILAIYFPQISGVSVPRYRDVLGFLLTPPLIALLMAQLIANHRHWLWSWLESRPIRYLGTISYSLYLYQQIILGPVEHVLHAWPRPLAVAGAIGATVLVASGSYFFVERPFLRWKIRRLNMRSMPLKSK